MTFDALFDTDDHGKSKELAEQNADIFKIMHLIDMKPGTDVINPDKGINIRSYVWRNDNSAVNELKAQIQMQVQKYTDIIMSNVQILSRNGKIAVGIQLPTIDDLIVFTVVDGEKQIQLDQLSLTE